MLSFSVGELCVQRSPETFVFTKPMLFLKALAADSLFIEHFYPNVGNTKD